MNGPAAQDPRLEVGDSLSRYLADIASHELLAADEEVELAQLIEAGAEAANRLERGGLTPAQRRAARRATRLGLEAKDRFVKSNLRLVVSQAKRYRSQHGVEFIDLIQEGNLGLIRAVEKFDWRKGFKFSTYATWWIRQAMQRAVAEKSRTVRLPNPLHDIVLIMKATHSRLTAELGREPTDVELAAESGLELAEVREASLVAESVSLESPVGVDGARLGDFVAHDDEDDPVRESEEASVVAALFAALDRLPEREGFILRLRCGFEDGLPRTHEEIGKRLNLGATRIRSIEKMALCRLRHPSFGLRQIAFV